MQVVVCCFAKKLKRKVGENQSQAKGLVSLFFTYNYIHLF